MYRLYFNFCFLWYLYFLTWFYCFLIYYSLFFIIIFTLYCCLPHFCWFLYSLIEPFKIQFINCWTYYVTIKDLFTILIESLSYNTQKVISVFYKLVFNVRSCFYIVLFLFFSLRLFGVILYCVIVLFLILVY